MSELNLLGISGSLRRDSVNTKLVREAARHFGAAEFSFGDLTLPLYNGDDETGSGIPDGVALLASQIAAADAVIVSTPEYNQSLSGVLKNALDWISRTKGGPWAGKPVVLMSAAAGRAGGARAAYALRLAMTPFRPLMVPGPEILLAGAGNAFDENGHIGDERMTTSLEQAMAMLREAAVSHAQSRRSS
ncbi:MAG: NAD(P)H-dependent oxidoreductase [Pseudomonadota bacterium]